jgi:hypothetical protein
MTFKPAIWYPVALVLSAINFAAAGFATRPLEPLHVTVHVVLALSFGVWAYRLRRGASGDDSQERLDALEGEVGNLRRELNEMQERLDFTERLLAQGAEARRVGPQR